MAPQMDSDGVVREAQVIEAADVGRLEDVLGEPPTQDKWAAAEAQTDADIEAAVAADPDAGPILGDEFFERAKLVTPPGSMAGRDFDTGLPLPPLDAETERYIRATTGVTLTTGPADTSDLHPYLPPKDWAYADAPADDLVDAVTAAIQAICPEGSRVGRDFDTVDVNVRAVAVAAINGMGGTAADMHYRQDAELHAAALSLYRATEHNADRATLDRLWVALETAQGRYV